MTGPSSVVVVRGTGYDSHGLPKFGPVLNARPQEPGDQYTVVYYSGTRPIKSYDIAVIRGTTPDAARPFRVLFEWTGRGFTVGAAMTYGTGPVELSYDARTNMIYTTASLAPVIVMTATGFVAGIVAGVVSAGEELAHATTGPRDVVMSVTCFEYDHAGRLSRLRMYLPDESTEVVRTTYFYEGEKDVPVKMESTSYPENRTRSITR